nr:hypothetical protein [Tanacetum cinerariifolium]
MLSKSPDTKSNHPHHQVRSCGGRRFLAGNVGRGVVLDFESFVVRLPSAEEESGDFVAGAGRRKKDCNVKLVASEDKVRKTCFGIWHIYATDVVSLSNHLKLTEEPAGADLKFKQGDNIT